MASYSQFLGHRITVHYRTSGFLLPASGTLVADSGRSIFLEQHMHIRGKLTYFRWEIPYQYIHRLQESAAPASEPAPRTVPQVVDDPADDTEYPIPPLARAASASGSTVILSPDPRKS